MDGRKHHVEIPSPALSDGRACACCLPRATVQAERKAAPSVLGCQLVPQHWNGGSACARERKATSLLPTVWGISSCALSQQQRNVPRKQIKLRYFVGITLRYLVGSGSAPSSLPPPQLWAPICTGSVQGSGSTPCLRVRPASGLSAEALASVPPGLQVGRWAGGWHGSHQ